MKFTHRRFINTFTVILVFVVPGLVLACGPYFTSAVFVASSPANNTQLIDGKIGIVRPGFSSEELFFAYRNLNEAPLNVSERAALNFVSGTSKAGPQTATAFTEQWATARKKALRPEPQYLWINTERELKNYSFFVNCTTDAFDTAAIHLNKLIASDGNSSASVRQWTEAQDLVFQNCSKYAGIPADPTADMTPTRRADRLYQIAAAHFYAMHYDVAAEEFRAIARDTTSPWHDVGLFLAARCYLRKATVGQLDGVPQPTSSGDMPPQTDQDSMRKALMLLQEVAADKSLGRVHDSALRLISFAQLHLDPDQQALKLSASIRQPSKDAQFATHLHDYLHLLRSGTRPGDELGEWIEAVKKADQSSIERWRSHPASQPWLSAALLAANGKSADAPGLVAAALKVDVKSPAYATAQYHAARLRYERSEFVQVREQIDKLLKVRRKQLDPSTIAALSILRSRAADSLADFSQFAAMPPTGFDIPDQSPGEWDPCPSGAGGDNRACATAMITPAAAAMINHMPLSVLVRLASLNSAPMPLRRAAAQIAFERGVLLGNFTQADSAARLLSAQSKQDATSLRNYLAAHSDEERRFSAAFVMLHWPGVTPSLNVSFMRDGVMRELSSYRNNWWNSAQGPKNQSSDPFEYLPADDSVPHFLDKAERTVAEREYAELGKVGSASIWLPRVVIAWAKLHHDDPQVPEALHLAVTATHFGSDTFGASPFSKEAFHLLHKSYPVSPWTAKTKYYY